jgi:DNA polymerase I-like protein with 3'-5' exonuclease and polymerase domains
MIQAWGSTKPVAFLIADKPHGEDLRSNYALTGYQETMLKQFCLEAKLNLSDFWRTCLIKDEIKEDFSTPKEAEAGAKFLSANPQYTKLLIDEINVLNPFLLIPLGELSFHLLTGLTGIRKFRGSVLPINGVQGLSVSPPKVMPILGPAPYLNEDYKMRLITQVDFKKIPKYLNDGPIPDNYYKIWVCRTSASFRDFLNRSYKTDGLLVFDIETYMNIPTCISFCFDGFESVCVPLLDSEIDRDNRVLMMDLIAKVLASPIRKVNQNVKFDWKTLERWGFQVSNVVGDTMLASATIICEFPRNLGFLTSIYTDLPYFKDEGREFDPTRHKREQFYLYNAKDSLSTHQIYTKQLVEIQEVGVSEVYSKMIQLMPIYRSMEDRGLRVDETQRDYLLAKYETHFEIEVMKLQQLTGEKYINPLSSPQMNRLVFETLGFKKIRGIKGTDEESLDLLMAEGQAERSPIYGKQILRVIINCRKFHKVIEILELPLYPDGRFRCEYNLAGAKTGRTTSGSTTDYFVFYDRTGKIKKVDIGHSFQTFGKHGFVANNEVYGKDLRTMFIPSRGYTFVECDLSQAEARVDAVLAQDYEMLGVFDGPVGIHKLTGSWVYECKPEEIKKETLVEVSPGLWVDRYYMAKTIRHAGERNMGDSRLASMATIPLEEARKVLRTFHKYQPKIRSVFHRDVTECIRATRCLIAPNGRRRDFFDRINNHTFNEGISQLPQSIVSDQTKFSFIPTMQEMPWTHLLVEAHDGSLAEVPTGLEEKYIVNYKKNIETPIDFSTCSLKREFKLVIPCEATISKESWGRMKEIKV